MEFSKKEFVFQGNFDRNGEIVILLPQRLKDAQEREDSAEIRNPKSEIEKPDGRHLGGGVHLTYIK